MCILIWIMLSIATIVIFIIVAQVGIDAISCIAALCMIIILGGLAISIICRHEIQAAYVLRLNDKIAYCEQLLQKYESDYPNVFLEKEKYEQKRINQRKLMDSKYVQFYEQLTIQTKERQQKYKKLKSYEQLLNN